MKALYVCVCVCASNISADQDYTDLRFSTWLLCGWKVCNLRFVLTTKIPLINDSIKRKYISWMYFIIMHQLIIFICITLICTLTFSPAQGWTGTKNWPGHFEPRQTFLWQCLYTVLLVYMYLSNNVKPTPSSQSRYFIHYLAETKRLLGLVNLLNNVQHMMGFWN